VKTVEFSVAGKTFMAGEYLALLGGPALILSTEPRFRLQVSKTSNSKNPFHPESPAGRLWSSFSQFFSQYKLRFNDPYQIGGFGASSAQFALLHAFWQLKEDAFEEAERFFDWHQMLQDYHRLNQSEVRTGFSPSGADVVGVCAGGLTWFDRNNGKLQTFAWPFQDMEFFVAHTGRKLATHEHLKSLTAFSAGEFLTAMESVQQGLIHINFEVFLAGLRHYRELLQAKGWVADFTQETVAALEQNPAILFAKGCGAMGSDVILAFCEKCHSKEAQNALVEKGLRVIADSSQLSQGLQIRNFSMTELSL
jgi:mevalonate kinase